MQTNSASCCNGAGSQVRWFGPNDSACCVATALKIDKCQVQDGTVALDRSDNAVGNRVVVGVSVRL